MVKFRIRRACFRWLIFACLVPLLGGCAGAYFRPAEAPRDAARQFTLETLPFEEYWTGLVFNGHKIGFTRFRITPESEGHIVHAEAAMHFRFLGVDKKVTLKSRDRIADNLTLIEFEYEYNLDGTHLEIAGSVGNGKVETLVRSAGSEMNQSHPAGGKVYPTSVIALYPVLYGLDLGREHVYSVFDGETQSVAEVRQRVVAFEHSDLFEGAAFKIKTSLHGQEVDTWIDTFGRPVLEMSLGGIFIAGLESESMARRHLTLAALNKTESLLDFSRISTLPAIDQPRMARMLEVEFHGFGDFEVPNDALQQCNRSNDSTVCRIVAGEGDLGHSGPGTEYLNSSLPVPSRAPEIRRLAHTIAASSPDELARIEALVDWIQTNIEQAPVDVFSALDVLRERKAECQGNTYLYAALARAQNIPTRVVNGIVYSESGNGFLYHTWAESLVDGRWFAVDPTFGQTNADATHVKLIEGESLAELGPLTQFMGRVKARVRAVAY